MRLIESFKKKKLILLNIFLTLYIGINLIGGEKVGVKNLKNKLLKIGRKNFEATYADNQ